MVFSRGVRRRRKTLREEVLSSKAKATSLLFNLENDSKNKTGRRDLLEDNESVHSFQSTESFLGSTPSSLKGTFLLNKLENPLFRPLISSFSSLSISNSKKSSALKKVKNASDFEFDGESEEDDDEDTGYDQEEELEEDELIETESSVRNPPKPSHRIISLTSFKRSRLRRSSVASSKRKRGEKSTRSAMNYLEHKVTRVRWNLFPSRYGENTKERSTPLRRKRTFAQRKRMSSDSNTSHSSVYSSYDNESELERDVEGEKAVGTLTKIEENLREASTRKAKKDEKESYLLYTHTDEPVRLQFFFDYLLISPIASKLSLSLSPAGYRYRKNRSKYKLKPRIVYYEDLASWTNNSYCLRLTHIKNKNTADQERSEIKLFVNKKKVVATPERLNNILKNKVSVLISGKLNCSVAEAREMLERNVSEQEMKKVVQEIDRSGERCITESYTKNLLEAPTYELYNV